MNDPQFLLDMPVLLVILLALVGGIFGEMWRADKDGASGCGHQPLSALGGQAFGGRWAAVSRVSDQVVYAGSPPLPWRPRCGSCSLDR